MALQQLEDIRQIAQATIVTAPDREAGLACAEQLAAALVCQGSGPRPCGACRACRKAAAGIHPDIIRVRRPEDDKGRQKKEIQVDQIRRMAADALVLPNESERKVYLIEDADTMNAAAQNAALKLLEEPPRGVWFLLCAGNPALLLPTVRSRCLTLRLGGEAAASGESDSAALLAEAFIRGDALAWFKAAFPCEKLDRDKFDRLIEDLDAAAALRAKAGEGETRARALRLSALTFRLREMRKVNVSAGHCLGWLCTNMNEEAEG